MNVVQKPGSKAKMTLSLDYRIIVIVLLLVIVAMLAVWRPWEAATGKDAQSIKVTGEATVTEVPDEFLFSPYYQFENEDKDAALKDMTEKSDEVVAKLKELGVDDSRIKTNSDGNKYGAYPMEGEDTMTYTLSISVKVGARDLAQKVQDYLITTSPSGTVSPYATFSDAKKKEVESKARDAATKEARAKAEQSAKNLGFTLGKVKSVEDDAGFGEVYPLMRDGAATDSVTSSEFALQPGENDLTYRVTVVYYLR